MEKHVCPWWMGYFLIIPLRKYLENPEKILGPYIKPGMKIIDYGSAMGYFSLPMARMTGSGGKVYCVDIQEKMLDKLKKRAENAGLEKIIEPVLLNGEVTLHETFKNKIDFAMLYAVAHEVPDQQELFITLCAVLKTGGQLLFAEPKGHVSTDAFNNSLKLAEKAGFKQNMSMKSRKGHAVLLEKI